MSPDLLKSHSQSSVVEDGLAPSPSSTTALRQVTLYLREGCSLCAEMEGALEALQNRYTFLIQRIDIDADPQLARRFNAKVPVLALDGEILCCHFLDMPALTDELSRDD